MLLNCQILSKCVLVYAPGVGRLREFFLYQSIFRYFAKFQCFMKPGLGNFFLFKPGDCLLPGHFTGPDQITEQNMVVGVAILFFKDRIFNRFERAIGSPG